MSATETLYEAMEELRAALATLDAFMVMLRRAPALNPDGVHRSLEPVVTKMVGAMQILEQIYAGQAPTVPKGSPFTAYQEENIRRGARHQFWLKKIRAEELRSLEAEQENDHG